MDIRKYQLETGEFPFDLWFSDLKDMRAKPEFWFV